MNPHNLPNLLLIMMTPPGRPTHHAPSVSLNSFKCHCFAAVAAASLLLPALPASAISVSIVENSATRFAFDVLWGEKAVPGAFDYTVDGYTWVDAFDGIDYISIVVQHYVFVPSPLPLFVDFHIVGGNIDRAFDPVDVTALNAVQAFGLPGNPYGGRFVYGDAFPVDPPTGVPDEGSVALLLSAGLAGLALLRRTVV